MFSLSKISLFFLSLSFYSIAWGQKINCLEYDPVIVKISGVIQRHTFPGRPNYESIKKGDEPERVWILKLKKNVCVRAKEDDELNESENNISRIQLVLIGKQYDKYRHLLGRKVTASGQLFHAITGHHHTKVLLTVVDIVLN